MLSDVASALAAHVARASRSAWTPHLTSISSVDRNPPSTKWPTNQPRKSAPSSAAWPTTTSDTSDDALVAAVDRDLRARRAREQRAAHLGHQLGHIAAGDLDAQDVAGLVL